MEIAYFRILIKNKPSDGHSTSTRVFYLKEISKPYQKINF
jgi:hypothetical protein